MAQTPATKPPQPQRAVVAPIRALVAGGSRAEGITGKRSSEAGTAGSRGR